MWIPMTLVYGLSLSGCPQVRTIRIAKKHLLLGLRHCKTSWEISWWKTVSRGIHVWNMCWHLPWTSPNVGQYTIHGSYGSPILWPLWPLFEKCYIWVIFDLCGTFLQKRYPDPLICLKNYLGLLLKSHGNLRVLPQCHLPPRNKAVLRDY